MLRVRVVYGVHGNGFRIVIDGNVDWPAESFFDGGRRASAASKVIDNQLVGVDIEQQSIPWETECGGH